jgi:chromosome segregation ATPase
MPIGALLVCSLSLTLCSVDDLLASCTNPCCPHCQFPLLAKNVRNLFLDVDIVSSPEQSNKSELDQLKICLKAKSDELGQLRKHQIALEQDLQEIRSGVAKKEHHKASLSASLQNELRMKDLAISCLQRELSQLCAASEALESKLESSGLSDLISGHRQGKRVNESRDVQGEFKFLARSLRTLDHKVLDLQRSINELK